MISAGIAIHLFSMDKFDLSIVCCEIEQDLLFTVYKSSDMFCPKYL